MQLVTLIPAQNGFVVNDERIIVPTDTFQYSYEQLEEKNALSCGFVGEYLYYYY